MFKSYLDFSTSFPKSHIEPLNVGPFKTLTLTSPFTALAHFQVHLTVTSDDLFGICCFEGPVLKCYLDP